jgi:hypothetical protein
MEGDPEFLNEEAARAKANGSGARAKAEAPSGNANERPKLDHVAYEDINRPSAFGGRKLVKGVMSQGQTSLVFGPHSCRKTFMMMDLALHVAAGVDWGGCKVEQGGVVYVAAEAGGSITDRVLAWKLHHKIDVLPFEVVISSVDLCNKKHNDLEGLRQLVEEVGARMEVRPTLIIIDTVARALAGGNENSPDDIGRFVRAMDWLRDKLGCHIAAVHHIGKDRERGARGHSSLIAAVDTGIEVEAIENVSTLMVVKQRNGPAGLSKSFRLCSIWLGNDEDDDPITSCVVEWTDPPIKDADGNAGKFFKVLNEALERDGTDDSENGRMVKHDTWRDACRAVWTGKPDSFRNTFNRARDKLTMRTGPVGSKGDVVWIKSQGQLEIDNEPF